MGKKLIERAVIVVLSVVLIFEIFSLSFWIALPFWPSIIHDEDGLASWFIETSREASGISILFSSILAIALVFCWIPYFGRFVLGQFPRPATSKADLNKNESIFKNIQAVVDDFGSMFPFFTERATLVVMAAVVLGFAVASYPYLPGLNPSGKLLGVDSPYYLQYLRDTFPLGDFADVARYMFFESPDRSLSIVLIYSGWRISGLADLTVIQFSPVLLVPVIAITIYLFARQMGLQTSVAALSSLFSAFSFQVTVAMYGGLLANLVGLVFFYLFVGFALFSFAKKSWRLLGFSVFLQGLLLFAHSHSWGMGVGILAVYLGLGILRFFRRHCDLSEILMIAALLISGFALNSLRNLILGYSFFESEVGGVITSRISFSNLPLFFSHLGMSIGRYMENSFTNPILWFLAFLGGVALTVDDRDPNRFVMASLMAVSVPFLFGNFVVQTRVLYNLPIQIFSAIGLLFLANFVSRLAYEKKKTVQLLFLLVFLLANASYIMSCQFHLSQTVFGPAR